MCGIAGIWSLKNELLDKVAFDESLKSLQHRGPDEGGSHSDNHMILGACRLKIIDLEKGNQPIYDHVGHSMVFNGAIYNYPELAKRYELRSKSDTSILFEMLKRKGELAIDQLRGMFAFAFYDAKADQLLLARDRVGQKPLYYFHNDNVFLFASELKALKKLMLGAGITPKINQQAIYHYLCLSNIPEPETIYENVYALSPGYQLSLNAGNLSFTKYWDYSYHPKKHLSKEEVLKKTHELIEESVALRLRADVPIGLFLSGGWDSSVLAYEISKQKQDITAYTVNYPFKTSQNEAKIASRTAKQFGLKHEVISLELDPLQSLKKLVETYDQPFADTSAIPNLAITEAASNKVKVMLNGDGGDEQFAGYRRYFLARHASKFQLMKHFTSTFQQLEANRRSSAGFLSRVSRIMKNTDGSRYLRYTVDMLQAEDAALLWKGGLIKETAEELIKKKKLATLQELDQLMHYDRKFNLLSGILVKMDRASMAHSVEARSPFLDHELFDFTSKLPDSFKVNGTQRKYLLKALYTDKLPEEVVKAKKVSFEAPIAEWLQHDFEELIHGLLMNRQSKIFEYLHFEEVQPIVERKKFKDRNLDYIIYSLLILAIWLEENA